MSPPVLAEPIESLFAKVPFKSVLKCKEPSSAPLLVCSAIDEIEAKTFVEPTVSSPVKVISPIKSPFVPVPEFLQRLSFGQQEHQYL